MPPGTMMPLDPLLTEQAPSEFNFDHPEGGGYHLM